MLESLNQSHRGRIGELLTAAYLESLGAPCSIVHQDQTDILAWIDDEPIRVQVKSRTNVDHKKSYKFSLTTKESGEYGCDVFALVALDLNVVMFDLPPSPPQKSKRYPIDFFDEKKTEATWRSALHHIMQMRGNSNES